jgi:hypothetical protein
VRRAAYADIVALMDAPSDPQFWIKAHDPGAADIRR